MNTEIVKIDAENIDAKVIDRAAETIKNGGLVAFPTETVYGLGANALDAEASKKIYEAKGRPSDNPLIAHIASIDTLKEIVEDVNDVASKLIEKFWPGPMTLIFRKKALVPDSTTGGLDTLAVRFPSNEIAKALIEKSGLPIAAPSANTSGKPSPTKGEHVIEDLDGKVDMIIDGGVVGLGLESTIIDVTDKPTILRPGFITQEMLEQVIEEVKLDKTITEKPTEDFSPKAPGMKYKHYAPQTKLVIVKGEAKKVADKIKDEIQNKRAAIITVDQHKDLYKGLDAKVVSWGNLEKMDEIAHKIFDELRMVDEWGVDVIYCEGFEEKDLGLAVMNRLTKAAGYQVIDV
ncbi:MAG: threonylcarbamoyl-AMP synthase [Eubacterium sp.]|nr:threonylcarbamoyl-AMP synthase [Eubacterium sp.]